jgi:arginyl-tRNA synthetase
MTERVQEIENIWNNIKPYFLTNYIDSMSEEFNSAWNRMAAE